MNNLLLRWGGGKIIGAARLAQSVERLTLNQVVVGSSPTVGVHLFAFSIPL